MKTFRQFIEELLEDYKTPSQRNLEAARRIRRSQGRRAYLEYLKGLQDKKNRNLPDDERHSNALKKIAQEQPLKPGQFLRWDREKGKYVSNLP